MAAGDFIQAYNEQINAQKMWNDGRHKRELQKPVPSAMAVMSQQNVAFEKVMQGGRCVGVEAIYFKSCNDDVVDCEDGDNDITDCDVSGIEAETAKKVYTPNVCLTKSLKVSADDCAGFNSFEEKLTFMKLKMKATLEAELNKKVIASLVSNAQANTFNEGGTISGTKVTFGSSSWIDGAGAKLLPKFHISAEKNQIYDAYMINGTNFYEAKWLYDYKEKSGSDDRYDDVFSQGPYQMFWDITNMDTVIGDKASFLIDRSAIAFFGQNEYENDIKRELKSDMFVYREPSMRLNYRNGQTVQPVYFDVTEQWDCAISSGDPVKNRRYQVVNIEYVLRGGLVTGTPDCGGGTGILHFEQS